MRDDPHRPAQATYGEEPWDLLVVGGGTAGLVGATTAAALGARTLLVERDRTGGDCLWTGCVPSKALVASATAAAEARDAARLGVRVGSVEVDLPAVMAHVQRAVATIAPVDSPEALEAAGVRVLAGDLRFTGPSTAEVDGRPVRFRQALLATGTAPAVPPVPGLAEAAPLTSESVWDLRVLPAHLLVVGGGTIGCELGQALARLGAGVTIVEAADRLLPEEDPVASDLLVAAMEADGVTVLTGRSLDAMEDGTAVLSGGSRHEVDTVLVAAGRTARTAGLGLDALGVELDDQGRVLVDAALRTTAPRVWAAGDVTPHPRFTHLAGVHASVAASNAVLGVRRSADDLTPRVTFTQPEVAAVGVATHDLPPGHRLLELPHTHVDRAVAEGRTAGVTRLVVDRRGRVRGATVVGPRAGETLGELGLAVAQGIRATTLAGVTHAYPTWNDGPWNASIAELRASLGRRPVGGALRTATRARRWWLDRRRSGSYRPGRR